MIHQFVPMLHRHDAVGRQVIAIQEGLRGAGIDSKVFVERIDPDTVELTETFDSYDEIASSRDLLVYQFATAATMLTALIARKERLAVIYHNITPAQCFRAWDNPLARRQDWGRHQLGLVAPRASLGIAVSEFNRADLLAAGFDTTAVIPPVPEPARQDTRGASQRDEHRWLSVGRLSPNKALEVAIVALALTRSSADPSATLSVVGRSAVESYDRALRHLVGGLRVGDAVEFVGAVDESTLNDHYARAGVVVVPSVHEGFCLQVVEAMERGVPVVATSAGALPEVVGDAGVLVDANDPVALALGVARLRDDHALRDRLVDAGRARVMSLEMDRAAPLTCETLIACARRAPLPPGAKVRLRERRG